MPKYATMYERGSCSIESCATEALSTVACYYVYTKDIVVKDNSCRIDIYCSGCDDWVSLFYQVISDYLFINFYMV